MRKDGAPCRATREQRRRAAQREEKRRNRRRPRYSGAHAGSPALQLTRLIADALPVGPILVGPAKPARVPTPSVTARGIVDMTAMAAAEAAGVESTLRTT